MTILFDIYPIFYWDVYKSFEPLLFNYKDEIE